MGYWWKQNHSCDVALDGTENDFLFKEVLSDYSGGEFLGFNDEN